MHPAVLALLAALHQNALALPKDTLADPSVSNRLQLNVRTPKKNTSVLSLCCPFAGTRSLVHTIQERLGLFSLHVAFPVQASVLHLRVLPPHADASFALRCTQSRGSSLCLRAFHGYKSREWRSITSSDDLRVRASSRPPDYSFPPRASPSSLTDMFAQGPPSTAATFAVRRGTKPRTARWAP